MSEITFKKISKEDTAAIELIAEGYWREWNIEKEITRQQLLQMPAEGIPLHLLMLADCLRVVTGGLYTDVRLIAFEPRFAQYSPWLALVYTPLEFRNRGYGYQLCQEIQRRAHLLGLKKIYLYTITAETLYERLGWKVMERITYKNEDCAVMMPEL